ncbi:hypothetical protein BS78_04G062400 [Paspalum vaginatum]|nr:hypothetical protein BS78_04G062400 [Paspalum vaginatum]
MEAPSAPSLSALRRRLRATVCCCLVGNGGSGGGLGERMRWRSRPGVGDFRYDPLSYALNFDEGDCLGVDAGDEDHDGGRRRGFVCRSFSAQLKPAPRAAFEAA